MAYIDLDELPQLIGKLGVLSGDRWALGSFVRSDRLFDPRRSLGEEVRALIAESGCEASRGPIRVLTQLRWFGYYFSPLNLYYVFNEGGSRVEQVLAEVNNTPWGERHAYVLADTNRQTLHQDALRFQHKKRFHVSPFMDMHGGYRWRLTQPGERLEVSLAREAPGERSFHANLAMRRKPLTKASLRRAAVRRPWMTAQITAAIYYQALKLWWKRCPYFPHPNGRPRTNDPATSPCR